MTSPDEGSKGSYVLIHSLSDGTWLAESPTFPACKGQASSPDKAWEALLHSVQTYLTAGLTKH